MNMFGVPKYTVNNAPQLNTIDSIRSLPTSPQHHQSEVWSPTATSPRRLLQFSISFI
jgi:hypothetical protein